jgi:site-specific DNA-adenine methylase
MKYGIPYMGSKSDIAEKLMRLLPKSNNLYDLFGGGFAFTHAAILHKKSKNYFFNEIQSDVVTLVQQAIAGEFNYSTFKPQFISREEFFEQKDINAFVRCLWSFGNNQKNYIFSKEIEPLKKSLHDAVIFDIFDETAIKMLGISKWPFNVTNIKQKRLATRYLVNKKINNGIDLQQLEQLQLEQLQQLERLQRLQQLQQLDFNLSFSFLDYRAIQIEPDSVIYCDPPYANTAKYSNKREFNSYEFWQWASAQQFPLFVSEYTIPNDFVVIGKYNRKTKLSPVGTVQTTPELLACNYIAHNMYFKKKP